MLKMVDNCHGLSFFFCGLTSSLRYVTLDPTYNAAEKFFLCWKMVSLNSQELLSYYHMYQDM